MSLTYITGHNIRWFADGGGVLAASSGTLEITTQTRETTREHKDIDKSQGNWVVKESGTSSASGNVDGVLVLEGNIMSFFELQTKGISVPMEYRTTEGTPFGFSGMVKITSIKLTAQEGEDATYSISCESTGPLTPITQ